MGELKDNAEPGESLSLNQSGVSRINSPVNLPAGKDLNQQMIIEKSHPGKKCLKIIYSRVAVSITLMRRLKAGAQVHYLVKSGESKRHSRLGNKTRN